MSKLTAISQTPRGIRHFAMWAMAVAALALPMPTNGGVVRPLTTGVGWRYWKGMTAPTNTWNTKDFDDSQWAAGRMPFSYGNGAPGTVLNDMGTNCTDVYDV